MCASRSLGQRNKQWPNSLRLFRSLFFLGLAVGCGHQGFGADVAFLKQHTEVVVLADAEGKAQIAVCPKLQGRVMTSSARGNEGASLGWVNRSLIESGKVDPQFNAHGGEDRIWLGPEGGPFALFFPPDAPMTIENWKVPVALDTEVFSVTAQGTDRIAFQKKFQLSNRAGTTFTVEINREIRLLNPADSWPALGIDPAPEGVDLVAFESDNRLTNAGNRPWRRETGAPSIWILGQFQPSDSTTVVLPFKPAGLDTRSGQAINDSYFGKIPPERLRIEDVGVAFLRADGKVRSKIGVGAGHAKAVLGAWDAGREILTIVQLSIPDGARDYVNSIWDKQDAPYQGDVVNVYNDGPVAEGKAALGPFYELESSSPAAFLAPGESITHVHRTLHFQGPREGLDAIANAILGVGLDRIGSTLPL